MPVATQIELTEEAILDALDDYPGKVWGQERSEPYIWWVKISDVKMFPGRRKPILYVKQAGGLEAWFTPKAVEIRG